ncbi:LPS assembly lipoprotein LptE [Ostreiculturibacter nitratireducens]|uniref:LPS assembly lipoprotein LptE n=1 Tax=Ostreiculturibacter nitratireducens TaxID=3075226 RepID=UPI0031B5E3D6
MSSSDRRKVIALLAALPLAACGFAPAYGPGGAASALFGRVAFDVPEDKAGFDLVGRLEERLGRTADGEFRLSYRIETKETGLAITPEAAVTRYNVTGSVAFTLTDSMGATRAEGQVSTFTSYSASGTTVSTATAREDAYRRLMVILADQIVTRLIPVGAGG